MFQPVVHTHLVSPEAACDPGLSHHDLTWSPPLASMPWRTGRATKSSIPARTMKHPPYGAPSSPARATGGGLRLQPSSGALGRELRAIRLVADGLQDGTPLLMTVFSP
jgi:hypothetical protein